MRNKRSLLSACSICVFLFLVVSCIFAGSNSKKELFFGPVVSGLEGTELIASKSQGGTSALIKKTSLAGDQQETLHFSLDMSQISLDSVRGKDYINIEGLKPSANPSEPQLPFKSFIITLPSGSKVSSVNVSGVSYRPVLNKLDIVRSPLPVGENLGPAPANAIADKTEKQNAKNKNTGLVKCSTCNSGTFFPGNLASYVTSEDNKNLFVFIKFFPMQYIQKSQRAILITDADITVNYQVEDKSKKTE